MVGKSRGDVDKPVRRRGDDRRPAEFRPPDPAGQRAGIAIDRQGRLFREIQFQLRHGRSGWFDTAEPRLEGDTAEACLEGETAEPCLKAKLGDGPVLKD